MAEWTPIKSPPKKKGDYLITWASGICDLIRFISIVEYLPQSRGKYGRWDIDETRTRSPFYGFHDIKVLAWMELPEVYKGD